MTAGETPQGAPPDPVIGRVISDRYRVLKKLGEGGMGSVYLAEHVLIEKKLALKLLSPELSSRTDLAARFLQEARSASKIGHENVIDISDFGQSSDGFVYIAMEYLQGVDLGETVRQGGPMPWARARGIVLQICKALRAAHAQGIVHRDMKPENIFLIQREGRPDFVKLLDFGIAKVMGLHADAPRLTRTGMIFGTPEYMAPEQAEGKEADHRVDIYATGCVIYHLVTGETPFKAESFVAMLTKHLLEDAVPPTARRPDLGLSPAIDALVMRALEKDRDRRWQSVDDLLLAVTACEPTAPARATVPMGIAATTRELGGSGSLPVQVVTSARSSDTALIPPEPGQSTDVIPRPSSSSRKIVLVAVGALVGTVAALIWALAPRSAPPVSKPAPVAQPARASEPPPAPAAATPPPVAPAAATPPPAAEAASAEAAPVAPGKRPRPAHGASHRPEARRPSAESESGETQPPSARPPATPPELKPFPQ